MLRKSGFPGGVVLSDEKDELESNHCQSDTTISAEEYLVAENVGVPGVMVMFTLSLYEPALPASCILLVVTLGLDESAVLEDNM